VVTTTTTDAPEFNLGDTTAPPPPATQAKEVVTDAPTDAATPVPAPPAPLVLPDEFTATAAPAEAKDDQETPAPAPAPTDAPTPPATAAPAPTEAEEPARNDWRTTLSSATVTALQVSAYIGGAACEDIVDYTNTLAAFQNEFYTHITGNTNCISQASVAFISANCHTLTSDERSLLGLARRNRRAVTDVSVVTIETIIDQVDSEEPVACLTANPFVPTTVVSISQAGASNTDVIDFTFGMVASKAIAPADLVEAGGFFVDGVSDPCEAFRVAGDTVDAQGKITGSSFASASAGSFTIGSSGGGTGKSGGKSGGSHMPAGHIVKGGKSGKGKGGSVQSGGATSFSSASSASAAAATSFNGGAFASSSSSSSSASLTFTLGGRRARRGAAMWNREAAAAADRATRNIADGNAAAAATEQANYDNFRLIESALNGATLDRSKRQAMENECVTAAKEAKNFGFTSGYSPVYINSGSFASASSSSSSFVSSNVVGVTNHVVVSGDSKGKKDKKGGKGKSSKAPKSAKLSAQEGTMGFSGHSGSGAVPLVVGAICGVFVVSMSITSYRKRRAASEAYTLVEEATEEYSIPGEVSPVKKSKSEYSPLIHI
jgi:hypothetical protein